MSPSPATFNSWRPLIVFAVSIIGTALSATWYLSAKINTFETRMTDVERDVSYDRYTLTMASEKALRTAIENPGIRVPDPRDPNKIIVVNPTTP